MLGAGSKVLGAGSICLSLEPHRRERIGPQYDM